MVKQQLCFGGLAAIAAYASAWQPVAPPRAVGTPLFAGGGFGAKVAAAAPKKLPLGKAGKAPLPPSPLATAGAPLFPPLPDEVAASLLPALPAEAWPAVPGPLPSAVRAHLATVHGFPRFDGTVGGCRFPGARLLHAEPVVVAVDG